MTTRRVSLDSINDTFRSAGLPYRVAYYNPGGNPSFKVGVGSDNYFAMSEVMRFKTRRELDAFAFGITIMLHHMSTLAIKKLGKKMDNEIKRKV